MVIAILFSINRCPAMKLLCIAHWIHFNNCAYHQKSHILGLDKSRYHNGSLIELFVIYERLGSLHANKQKYHLTNNNRTSWQRSFRFGVIPKKWNMINDIKRMDSVNIIHREFKVNISHCSIFPRCWSQNRNQCKTKQTKKRQRQQHCNCK